MSFFMNSRSATPYGTGDIGEPILDSGANFTSWLRTIKANATRQGLWPFLSGEKVLVNKPDLKEYRKDKGKGYEEYCGAREDYENQQLKVRDARWLLHKSVSPEIRLTIFDSSNPSDAIRTIKAQYQPPQYRAQLQAFTRIETVRLTPGKSMSQFIEELQSCRLDITDTQGTISDVFMLSKISRSLPEDYDDFIYTNILIVKECPALEDIFHKLLRLEGHMLDRAKA